MWELATAKVEKLSLGMHDSNINTSIFYTTFKNCTPAENVHEHGNFSQAIVPSSQPKVKF